MMDTQLKPPPRYRSYYLDYEAGHKLINQLSSSARRAAIDEAHVDLPNVSHVVDKTLQWMLGGQARQLDENFLKALAPQVAFRDFLAHQVHRINQFAALRYNEIEQEIRATCRSLRKLQTYDKKRASHRGSAAASSVNSVPTSHEAAIPSRYGSGNLENSSSRWSSEGSSSDLSESLISTDDGDDGIGSITTTTATGSFNVSSAKYATNAFEQASNATASKYISWWNQKLRRLKYVLECQEAEIVHLDMFIRMNYKSCIQLCQLFDNAVNSTVARWVTASLSRETFTNLALDRLLIFMSVAWEKWRFVSSRSYLTKDDEDGKKWVPPESFTRQTTKYWIPPEHVVRLKLSILRHMPYLIFGCSVADLESYVDPYCALENNVKNGSRRPSVVEPGKDETLPPHTHSETSSSSSTSDSARNSPFAASERHIEEGQLITSIYFDSTSGYSYRRRTLRLEGAELIRFRWYGSNNGEPSKPIFVERKTHHESWTGESSKKERFSLPQKNISNFMTGSLKIEDYVRSEAKKRNVSVKDKQLSNMLELGKPVQECIVERHLRPMVRTSYQRAAFQLATSNDVRFSLDTNLCMVDEFVPCYANEQKEERSWCRWGEEILTKDQVVRFPYAVLEVKLQTASQPAWVSSILAGTQAVMVYKFSKFQHGMAFLHSPFVAPHGMPHWIQHLDTQHQMSRSRTRSVTASSQRSLSTATFGNKAAFFSLHSSGITRRTEAQPEQQEDALLRAPCHNGFRTDSSLWLSSFQQALTKTVGGLFPSSGPSHSFLHNAVSPGCRYLPLVSSHSGKGGAETPAASLGAPRCADTEDSAIRSRPFAKTEQRPRPFLLAASKQQRVLSPVAGVLPHATLTAKCLKRTAQRDIHQWNAEYLRRWTNMSSEDLQQVMMSRSLNVRKLDPKSFFASERTLLHYLEKALYIAGMAIILVNYGSPSAVLLGSMMGLLSIAVMLMSYKVFTRRSNKIARRMTKGAEGESLNLSDEWGPLLLSFIVGGGAFVGIISSLYMPQIPVRHRRHPIPHVVPLTNHTGFTNVVEGLAADALHVILGV